MSIGSGIAIYFVLWWTVLFAVLPFGIRSQSEAGVGTDPGNDPGAPVLPQLMRKALWTTLVSSIIFASGLGAYQAGYFNVERLSKLMGLPL